MLGADPKQLQTQVHSLLDNAIHKAKAIPQIAIETGAHKATNFNQQATQTVIMPSGDFDGWVSASASVQLAPKVTP